MYREIGEQFKLVEHHPGLPETITILEVVEAESCKGCYFKGFCLTNPYIKDKAGFCSTHHREDKKDVIFKKVEK